MCIEMLVKNTIEVQNTCKAPEHLPGHQSGCGAQGLILPGLGEMLGVQVLKTHRDCSATLPNQPGRIT